MLKDAFDMIIKQNPFARLGDSVYQVLYEAIIGLNLTPGKPLSETVLAKELNISRTPIRNAILRLADEGLLENVHGQAFVVASFKKEECQNLMEVRVPIEAQAAYWAAERIKNGQLAELETHMKAFSHAFDTWNIEELVLADHAFHQTIVDSACNTFISDLYRQITPRIIHYRNFLYNTTQKEQLIPIMGASVRIHRSVYNAVKLGFANEARECMQRDISGMSNIIGLWNE